MRRQVRVYTTWEGLKALLRAIRSARVDAIALKSRPDAEDVGAAIAAIRTRVDVSVIDRFAPIGVDHVVPPESLPPSVVQEVTS